MNVFIPAAIAVGAAVTRPRVEGPCSPLPVVHLRDLLVAAKAAHAVAYPNNDDPDWPAWYAVYLMERGVSLRCAV
jgi:hypothetical protein